MQLWTGRGAGFERSVSDAAETLVVVASSYPTLDELWTLWMLAQREPSAKLPAHWEAVCRYAEAARQGYLVDECSPERALQSVYRAVVDAHLTGATRNHAVFLERAAELLSFVDAAVAGGAAVTSDLFKGELRFARYLAALGADLQLYREDRARGKSFEVSLKPASDAVEPERKLGLLVLSKPTARQFKVWARNDADAVAGPGFALLLVEELPGEHVLSADPARGIRIGHLAAVLSSAERAHGGGDWYDGTRHDGTLIAAPSDGSRLSQAQVLEALSPELGLRKVSTPRQPAPSSGASRVWPALAAIALAAGVAATWARTSGPAPGAAPLASLSRADPAPVPTVEARGKSAPNLTADELFAQFSDGPPEQSALLVGVCSYKNDPLRKLSSPCNDVWELAHLLVSQYGYDSERVVILMDRDAKLAHPEYKNELRVAGEPTEQEIRSWVESFNTRIKPSRKLRAFLFYFSGHGELAGSSLAYLLPSNWEADRKRGRSHDGAGINIATITNYIDQRIRPTHSLILLDNCFSGLATGKGSSADEIIRARWKEQARFVMSASGAGEEAQERRDGSHSVFTQALLEGLDTRNGIAAADTSGPAPGDDPDGIVTTEELFRWVQRRTTEIAKRDNLPKQSPQFAPLDSMDAGQFLMVGPNWQSRLKK